MKVRYTRPALADLDTILQDIAERSPAGAARVQARLKAVIDLLPIHPNIGQATIRPGLRRLVVSPYPYLVFYRVTGEYIVIYGIRHGARRPSSMPK